METAYGFSKNCNKDAVATVFKSVTNTPKALAQNLSDAVVNMDGIPPHISSTKRRKPMNGKGMKIWLKMQKHKKTYWKILQIKVVTLSQQLMFRSSELQW